MSGLTAVQSSQGELAAVAGVLGVACIVGALFARERAPAVSVGLVAALTMGVITFLVSSREGPRGVPLLVLMSASVALAGSGLVAVPLLSARGPGRSLRRMAAMIAATAPMIGLAALSAIQDACPLYVGRGSGLCSYGNQDQLGGWTAAAGVIVGLDVLLIALLVWLTAARSAQSDRDLGEHSGVLIDTRAGTTSVAS